MMSVVQRSVRFLTPLFRRSISVGAVRCAEGQAKDVPEAKLGVPGKIPSDSEQATGLEKIEHDALMAGIEDPFNLTLTPPPGDGSKGNPFIVTSAVDERIIGCVCEPDDHGMVWMVLKSGPPQRCECGYWHVLKKGNPTKVEL